MSETGYATVVRESAPQRDGLFGALLLIFVLALVRGVVGAGTGSGRITVAAIFGALTLGTLVLWIKRRRNATWLEISDDHIELLHPNASDTPRLSKTAGDQLQFVTVGGYRSRHSALTIPGSGTTLDLQFFSKPRIKEACIAHGWRFA